MSIILTFAIIFIAAFLMSLRSMKDFNIPTEVKKVFEGKKVKGSIVFLKDKTKHYSSTSSSSSSGA